jgi:hypothetical protein
VLLGCCVAAYLDGYVAEKLEQIFKDGLLKHAQLNTQCNREITSLPADLALCVLEKFNKLS